MLNVWNPLVEILDDNNKPVKHGEEGELVVTTLGVEAMPLLRFKTGDVVKAHYEPCNCGRNTFRLGPVIGRKKQMIKYKGTTIYPPAMYDLLNDFSEIENYIIEIDKNEIGTDKITIKIRSKMASVDLIERLKDHFRAKLRVAPTIRFFKPAEISSMQIQEDSRKPVIFIDHR